MVVPQVITQTHFLHSPMAHAQPMPPTHHAPAIVNGLNSVQNNNKALLSHMKDLTAMTEAIHNHQKTESWVNRQAREAETPYHTVYQRTPMADRTQLHDNPIGVLTQTPREIPDVAPVANLRPASRASSTISKPSSMTSQPPLPSTSGSVSSRTTSVGARSKTISTHGTMADLNDVVRSHLERPLDPFQNQQKELIRKHAQSYGVPIEAGRGKGFKKALNEVVQQAETKRQLKSLQAHRRQTVQ